jgi:hypothetical protein
MRPISFGAGWWIGLAGVGLVIAVWGVWSWYRGRHARPRTMPWALFTELCHAHRLSSKDGLLLARLAHARQPEQPAGVFVEPDKLTEEQLDARLASRKANLARLKKRLFSGLDES